MKVFKWTDGSYLEDADHWRMAGIHREVYLAAKPDVAIGDFGVRTLLDGDMRDALAAADAGNERAKLAIEMYVYRVQKAIGSYYAAMTRTDAVVMSAGIGENSAELRELIFEGLAHMGMILDRERNHVVGQIGVNRIISIDDSPIKICVVTTDEEMRIARETDNLVSQLG